MIDAMFSGCVYFLMDLAKLTGMTYETVNVIIFCIFWPAFTVYLIAANILLRRKIKCMEEGSGTAK